MFSSPTKDLLIVLVIVLFIFGPKRLPGLGKQLGQGIREFRDSITSRHDDEESEERPQISRSSASGPAATPGGDAAAADPAAAVAPESHAAESAPSERR